MENLWSHWKLSVSGHFLGVANCIQTCLEQGRIPARWWLRCPAGAFLLASQLHNSWNLVFETSAPTLMVFNGFHDNVSTCINCISTCPSACVHWPLSHVSGSSQSLPLQNQQRDALQIWQCTRLVPEGPCVKWILC